MRRLIISSERGDTVQKSLVLVAVIVAALVVAYAALGTHPVAKVSSSESFTVAGTKVPVEGVPSWPVVAGDEIVAGNASAVVTFSDGSRGRLGRNTRARVEGSSSAPVLRLLDGAMAYAFARTPSLKLYAENNPITPATGMRGTALAGSATVADVAGVRSLGMLKADDKGGKDKKNPPPVSDHKKE